MQPSTPEQPTPDPATHGRPVIILVAFGTSVPAAQAALENIDTRVRAAHPGHEVLWAFTSGVIMRKLKAMGQQTAFARGVPLRDLAEVYADLKARGVVNAVVQSLHVVPGQEYHKIRRVDPGGIRVRYGQPLMADNGKVAALARALAPRFGGPDTFTILCGHGNDHRPGHNRRLIALDRHVRATYPDVAVATVEGEPGTEAAFAAVRASGLRKVKFLPLMIVAGDHVMNDVMGEEEESWRSQLGLEATADGGMGGDPAVVDLFLAHLDRALADHAHGALPPKGDPVIVIVAPREERVDCEDGVDGEAGRTDGACSDGGSRRAGLERLDQWIRARMPDRTVRWAEVEEGGVDGEDGGAVNGAPCMPLPALYDELRAQGLVDMVLLSLDLVPGADFHAVRRVDESGLRVRYAKPLLADQQMVSRFAKALASSIPSPSSASGTVTGIGAGTGATRATILLAPGDAKRPGFNRYYQRLEKHLRATDPRTYLAMRHGEPTLEAVYAEVAAAGVTQALVVPLSWTRRGVLGATPGAEAGGAEASRWGVRLSVAEDLSAREAVLDLLLHRLRAAMAE